MPAEKLFDVYMNIAGPNQLAYANFVYDENFTGASKNQPCDVNIICGMTSEDTMPLIFYVMMRLLAKKQNGHANIYSYYFCRQLPGDELGAWHSSDLWYTYGALEKCWRLFTDDDRNLSNIMIKYFSNFIRTGDPNGEELVKWPSYEEDKKAFMHFDIVECKAKKTKLSQILKNTFVKKTLESGF
jgi:para-nitrobenzyl esterase